ncbi:MAG: hypothetical protein ACXWTP_12050, partial [Methylosarcina sp.]
LPREERRCVKAKGWTRTHLKTQSAACFPYSIEKTGTRRLSSKMKRFLRTPKIYSSQAHFTKKCASQPIPCKAVIGRNPLIFNQRLHVQPALIS